MSERKVQVFLYGTYMNLNILEKAGIKRRAFAPASVHGFELTVQPLANLAETGDGVTYGILANLTHAELDLLYQEDALKKSDAHYLPEPVIVFTRGGRMAPALTYICHDMKASFASHDYVDLILKPARDYGFPAWYVERIAAFKS